MIIIVITDDERTEVIKRAASEAMKKNTVALNRAISPSFENIILTCEQDDLIALDFRQKLLQTPQTTRCIEFIDYIRNIVEIEPSHLDTFLSILHKEGPLTSEVAKSVAKYCKYTIVIIIMMKVCSRWL